MDAAAVRDLIATELPDVEVAEASGDCFFFANPGGGEPDWRNPFATLVTGDRYDRASDLDRPGVYRLNIGVSRESYRRLFGEAAPRLGADGIVETGHDFTALDTIMPHPIYAPQFWVCVLNPEEETLRTAVWPLLEEAHERATRRQARRRAGRDG